MLTNITEHLDRIEEFLDELGPQTYVHLDRGMRESRESLTVIRAAIDELTGTLPGRIQGAQAVADEKCRCFLARAEAAESGRACWQAAALDAEERIAEMERQRAASDETICGLHVLLSEAKAELGTRRAMREQVDCRQRETYIVELEHRAETLDAVSEDRRTQIKALIAERDLAVEALRKAYFELNTIHARDGKPWTGVPYPMPTEVDQDYFTSVVDECRAALSAVQPQSAARPARDNSIREYLDSLTVNGPQPNPPDSAESK